MALRKILKDGDPALRKVCRPVERFDGKLAELIEDMAQTMYDANGVGLAGPQVGILRRVFVVDIGDGLREFINPRILESQGAVEDVEGCLSYPNQWGMVTRPERVVVQAQDRRGETFILEAQGLMARAICHENDHLDGKIFIDLASRMLSPDELEG